VRLRTDRTHATGIDITPAMIERARALASERRLENVTWIAGDVEPLSIVVSRLALAHSTACSIDCAWIKVKPAMSSLLSRNAPSVTEIWPAALRTRLPLALCSSARSHLAPTRRSSDRPLGHHGCRPSRVRRHFYLPAVLDRRCPSSRRHSAGRPLRRERCGLGERATGRRWPTERPSRRCAKPTNAAGRLPGRRAGIRA
jgi:SAM-dependent methyltransferase